MSQTPEKSPTSSTSERTPSPIRETRDDDEDVDQLEPSSPIQRDSSPSQSTQGPTAPVGAMQVPPGMQLPPGFPPMMMMAAPDPNDPNAPPHPMIIPGGYTPMFYPYPGVYPSKSKRRQVKNACTNCQKACKKCDDQRPCPRCVKYGIADDCVDSVRKERKKGIKRGSYKKKRALICLVRLIKLTIFSLATQRRAKATYRCKHLPYHLAILGSQVSPRKQARTDNLKRIHTRTSSPRCLPLLLLLPLAKMPGVPQIQTVVLQHRQRQQRQPRCSPTKCTTVLDILICPGGPRTPPKLLPPWLLCSSLPGWLRGHLRQRRRGK